MKFVDEVVIEVAGGDGGVGSMSFRREKYIPRGGPDGGDGGDGGSVILEAASGVNTLVDYRYKRKHLAPKGERGHGEQKSGKSGEDLILLVPVGTMAYDNDTDECIGDLVAIGQRVVVAQGGFHGLGNTRFKSSINRAPRKTTPGTPGERRSLRLELKLLADVGLLGLPNAGKSSLIRAISAATPKVADYPFTTLHPHLGVVRVGELKSFVVADIPGLIEGAAEGAGLGDKFLRHLARNRILLHVVDVAPIDGSDPLANIKLIRHEVESHNPELAAKECWVVLNKIDLWPEEEREARLAELKQGLETMFTHSISSCDEACAQPSSGVYALVHEQRGKHTTKSQLERRRVYAISAVTGEGTTRLCQDIMLRLDELLAEELQDDSEQ